MWSIWFDSIWPITFVVCAQHWTHACMKCNVQIWLFIWSYIYIYIHLYIFVYTYHMHKYWLSESNRIESNRIGSNRKANKFGNCFQCIHTTSEILGSSDPLFASSLCSYFAMPDNNFIIFPSGITTKGMKWKTCMERQQATITDDTHSTRWRNSPNWLNWFILSIKSS